MTRNNRYQTVNVINTPGAFEPSSIGAYEATCKVELLKGELPRVHFSWRQEVFLFTEVEAEAGELIALGFPMKGEVGHSGQKSWCGYALAKPTSHLTFCNFRRYGWSWTPDCFGEHGYCSGPVYANGRSFYSSTPVEVVRDSFIEAWTEMRSELPSCFFTKEVYELLQWLLQDALEHISTHALVRGVNEAYVKNPVQVTGL